MLFVHYLLLLFKISINTHKFPNLMFTIFLFLRIHHNNNKKNFLIQIGINIFIIDIKNSQIMYKFEIQ